jgi:hypothetical protein
MDALLDFIFSSTVAVSTIAGLAAILLVVVGGFQWVGGQIRNLCNRFKKPPISQQRYEQYFQILQEFGEIQYQHNDTGFIYSERLLPAPKQEIFEMIKIMATWDSNPDNRKVARMQLMQLHKFQDIDGDNMISISAVKADPNASEKNRAAVQTQELQVIQMLRLAQELGSKDK